MGTPGELELAGRRALVVGLARSGVAAARLLASRGARVTVTDQKPLEDLPGVAQELGALGVELELGGHRPLSFSSAELVIVSPGVPWELPELALARRAGAQVLGELELGARFIPGPIAAITGTKGKSTTTAALGAMLRAAGQDVRVGGNIGEPVTGLLDGLTPETRVVLEVSSFQLEGTLRFHPQVAVFLNLSPDHLDRHPSFEHYARAKALIFRNQDAQDWAVINGDDPQVVALARETRARVVEAVSGPPGDSGAGFDAGSARLCLAGRCETLFERASLRVPGAHLAADLLCAATAARLLGAPGEAIARAVAAFDGVAHALERVAEIGGVHFFNDSKATNVDAARKSLETFAGPLHVIMGGRFKGGELRDLREPAASRVRRVLAIGEARPLIVEAFAGAVEVLPCDSLQEAVEQAYAGARPGDTVLLAPACSSFDMFKDYAERGERFKAAVRALVDRQQAPESRHG